MKDLVIETNNLTKKYKKEKVINNVNINVERGEIYGLVGENGSGKSTIMKMILGIVIPTSGDVKIFGENSEKKLNEGRKTIGSIVESPEFYPYFSAKKNLKYYSIQRGIEDDKLIDDVLKTVGLEDVGNKKFKDYSLGMKQRLGLARAIMIDPEILILDEPINGLDPSGIVELRKILLDLNKNKGITIIISSHILGELSQIATKYGFINKGVLFKEISSKELEKECRRYLRIELEDIEKAVVILEKEVKTLDYKVGNEGEIYLFDYIDNPEKIVKIFSENNIFIKSIKEEGINLEDYYMELRGGNKNA